MDRGHSVTISSGPAGNSVVSTLFSIDQFRVFQTRYDSRRDNARVDTILSYAYSSRYHRWLPPEVSVPRFFAVGGRDVLSVEENGRVFRLNRLQIEP